ncbi:MAG: P-II family nitrogen regulator [Chloroflexi bacterium]|nr:P-II family nitrogen regulator [Chloroflexota bacterium]
MKKIEAIIRPEKLGVVRKALEEVGYAGLTISDVRGHGAQRGIKEHFRGTEFIVDILPKVKVELVVPDSMSARVVKEICDAARTGAIGDGRVFVSTVDEAIRIRTGESGDATL